MDNSHKALIIYINEPLISHKTTIAQALHHHGHSSFLLLGIDSLLKILPLSHTKTSLKETLKHIQTDPFAKKVAASFRDIAVTFAELGHSLIIEDLSAQDSEMKKWKEKLKNFSCFYVKALDPAEDSSSPQQSCSIIQEYDLVIDLSKHTMKEIVEIIEHHLSKFLPK